MNQQKFKQWEGNANSNPKDDKIIDGCQRQVLIFVSLIMLYKVKFPNFLTEELLMHRDMIPFFILVPFIGGTQSRVDTPLCS